MNGTPKYALRAQRSAAPESVVEYMPVKAVIQMPTTIVSVKNAALAAVKRRRRTRRPKATISTAVAATGIADGEMA